MDKKHLAMIIANNIGKVKTVILSSKKYLIFQADKVTVLTWPYQINQQSKDYSNTQIDCLLANL